MNADPADQLRLLDLQEIDATLARLAQRRRTLPELAEIERLDEALRRVGDDVTRAETEVAALAREQGRFDADVEVVRARMARDQQRLDAGRVGSPKELESLQHELVSLHRRQSALEDEELEIMQRGEDAQRTLTDLAATRSRLAAERAAAMARRDAAFADIDVEDSLTGERREPLTQQLPTNLLALYEKIRAGSGGVGAARLFRGRCEGCHLSLPPAELNRMRSAPPEQVQRCEECQRILVRTADSGLCG